MYDYWNDELKDSDICSFYGNFEDGFDDQLYLYRYRSPEYHNVISLYNQSLHLSPNHSLNDAFEGVPQNILADDLEKYKGELGELAYMACFSETKDNLVMWGNYADSFKGFCVEYDIGKLFNSDSEHKRHIFPVLYDKRRPLEHDIKGISNEMKYLLTEIAERDIEHDDLGNLNDILPMFLTKAVEWSYECEWRLIYTNKQIYDEDKKELYAHDIYFPFVNAVYLGVRMQQHIKQDIIDRVQQMNDKHNCNASIYESCFKDETYTLQFDRIL